MVPAGLGTALKPAYEPIIVARKPCDKNYANNVLKHGTGALNIDGCRIGIDESEREVIDSRSGRGFGTIQCAHAGRAEGLFKSHPAGRWPANVILDEIAGAALDLMSGPRGDLMGGYDERKSPSGSTKNAYGKYASRSSVNYTDYGGASRFFYCAKASRAERGEGNNHPTVKPLSLMRWLVRLVTPEGGTVLDPFCGSGSTGVAALQEGFNFIGIEREPEYADIARRRLEKETRQPLLTAASLDGIGDADSPIRSGTSGSAVNQSGAATVYLMTRDL